jgi:phosphate transport system substrate-binding protein
VRDGTYQPLSRPIFVYVSKKSLDRPEVLQFTKFYVEKAVELVPEVGYVPLSEKSYKLVGERVDKRLTGSMFAGGSQVGVSLEKLMESGK